MSSTVAVDGFTITSTHESAKDMQRVLRPIKPESAEPRIVTDAGKDVPVKDDTKVTTTGDARPKAPKAAKPAEAAVELEAVELETETPEAKAERKARMRHDSQVRIDDLTRKARDAEGRAERAESRAAEIERSRIVPAREDARPEPVAARQATPAPTGDPKPSEDNFNTYADFLDARDDWRDRQKERQQAERQYAQARGEHIGSVVDGFLERLAGVARTDPDHKTKLAEFTAQVDPKLIDLSTTFQLEVENAERKLAGLAPIPRKTENIIADRIVKSKRAPALLLHFTEHPEEFQRVAALRAPDDIIEAVADIQARLEDDTAATIPERVQSRATPPVRAVTGSPIAASAAPAANDTDFDKYVKYMAGRKRAS